MDWLLTTNSILVSPLVPSVRLFALCQKHVYSSLWHASCNALMLIMTVVILTENILMTLEHDFVLTTDKW